MTISAYAQAAPEITEGVSALFGIATGSPESVRNSVIFGISALEGQSYGNDGPSFERKLGL